MCGRKFIDVILWQFYQEMFELLDDARPQSNFAPNYNIAPTHDVLVCHMDKHKRILRSLQWGLVPGWAKDKKTGYSMINARTEEIEDKRSFASLLNTNRCIVPVSGFYEWQRQGLSTKSNAKQAHAIKRDDGAPMLLAGLWTENQIVGAATYTILTQAANQQMSAIHHRMPVMLEPNQVSSWLEGDWPQAKSLYSPATTAKFEIYPVSNDVGKVSINEPYLLNKIEPEQGMPSLF